MSAAWVRWLVCGAGLALAGLGCDDDGPAAAPDRGALDGALDSTLDAGPDGAADATPDAQAPDGGPPLGDPAAHGLHIAPDGSLSLTWQGAPRARLTPAAWRMGVADAVDPSFHYNPYSALQTPPVYQPRSLRWVSPEAVTAAVDGDGAAVTLTLDFGALGTGTARLTVGAHGIDGHFTPPADAPVVYLGLRLHGDAEEAFYGLGEVFDTLNHRGHLRALQLELALDIESANNEVNVPVPLLLGTTGWGVFVDSQYPGAMAVATEAADQIDAVFGTGEFSADGLRFTLLAAAHPLDLIKGYYAVTGTPTLPAAWALGPWIWRDENDDQAQVLDDIESLRTLDLATTGIWIDRPYASGVSSFDFHPEQFPAPQAMIDRAHALGLRFALWHTSYVGEDQPATAALHAEAEANGYYPPEVGPIVNNWGRPVDLTNPAAYAWWQDLVRRYTAMGVEGYKLDYVQDVVPGLGRVRNRWRFFDGSTERTMHVGYQRLYHQVFAETLPPDGGFLLTRTGLPGDQVNGVIIWPGDLDSSLATRGSAQVDPRSGETYTATGGLPASLIGGLSLSASGFAFYGSDTGGYRHCPPSKETFVRWFEQTALSSVMQVGTSCNDVPWQPTPANGFDAEVLDLYRIYARLHLRLWPLAWTLAHGLADSGRPLTRPFGLQHPELDHHPDDAYFFGEDLLVAPVMVPGARARAVRFPAGRWFDWWTGAPRDVAAGAGDAQVDAPLGTLPLFLRAGGIVPLLRPTIDTLAPTTEPDRVDSFDDRVGPLHVRLAPPVEGEARLRLYDGTVIAQAQGPEGWRVTLTPGDVFREGFVVEAWGLPEGAAAQVDGAPAAGAVWADGRLDLPLPAGDGPVTVTVPAP